MFIPPINSHGLYPQTPPIDASSPPSSGVVASIYHRVAHQYLRVFVRSDRLAPQALKGLDSLVGCSCSKDQSAVSVPVSTRLLPLTSFVRHLTVCHIAASSLMVESRSIHFLRRILLLGSLPPQAGTLVIRYHIVNGSFIVRKILFSLRNLQTRFSNLFQISKPARVCGPFSSDRIERIRAKGSFTAIGASSYHAH